MIRRGSLTAFFNYSIAPPSQHFSFNALFASRVVSALSSTTTRDTSQTLPSVRNSRMSRPSEVEDSQLPSVRGSVMSRPSEAEPSTRGSTLSRPSETEDGRPSGKPQSIKQPWTRGGGRQSGGMTIDAAAAGSSLPAADTAAAVTAADTAAESPALFTATLTRRVPGRRSTTATLFQWRVQSGAQNIRSSMEQAVADQAATPSAYGSRHSAFGRQVSILKIGSDGAERYSLDSIAGGTPIHTVWDEETRMLAMQVGSGRGVVREEWEKIMDHAGISRHLHLRSGMLPSMPVRAPIKAAGVFDRLHMALKRADLGQMYGQPPAYAPTQRPPYVTPCTCLQLALKWADLGHLSSPQRVCHQSNPHV